MSMVRLRSSYREILNFLKKLPSLDTVLGQTGSKGKGKNHCCDVIEDNHHSADLGRSKLFRCNLNIGK